MTGDEYMQLLVDRQTEAITNHQWPTQETHGYEVKEFAKKLMFPLEKMVRAGDEELFTPPEKVPKPKPKPRQYRPASYWEGRVQSLSAQLEEVTSRGTPKKFDPAMVNLPLKGRAITDSQLEKYRQISKKLSHAEWMLQRAQYREANK